MAYNNGFPMGYQQMYPQYYPSPTAPLINLQNANVTINRIA